MTKADIQLQKNLQSNLHKKKFDAILNILKRPENDAYVSENLWNLIELVCRMVKTFNLLESRADVASCKNILLWLVNRGNPKKVLMYLLQQAGNSIQNHKFFCLLLEPLQCALQRAPGMRGKTLRLVFYVLNTHIETLAEPEDFDPWDEDNLFMHSNPTVQDASYVLSGYLTFIEVFADEVSFENMKTEENHYFSRVFHQQELLHRYILKLFYRPLLYHDLNMVSNSRPKSMLQTVCKGFVRCLSKICHNVFNLFKYDALYNDGDRKFPKACTGKAEAVNSLAFSNLSYLIFVENIASDFRPFVYSNFFLFRKNLRHILLLLESDDGSVLCKGLRLAETLLNRLDSEQLDYECIELEMFTEFPRLLLITACDESDTVEEEARELFKSFMSKCNFKGRYCVIMEMLSAIDDTDAEALLIDQYSDNVIEALDEQPSAECFLGKNFGLFVKKAFRRRHDELDFDIVFSNERLMALLQFLDTILTVDEREINATGIWDLTTYIRENFVAQLQKMFYMTHFDPKQSLPEDFHTGKNNISPYHGTYRQWHPDEVEIMDIVESMFSDVKELLGPVTED